jgi:hypothetical protein
MFIYLAKMLFSKFLLIFVLQLRPIIAQLYFTKPSAGEVIMGGVPFTVSVPDSLSAPYFSQMTNFSLLLLAGNYSSPVSTLRLPQIPLSYSKWFHEAHDLLKYHPNFRTNIFPQVNALRLESLQYITFYSLQFHYFPTLDRTKLNILLSRHIWLPLPEHVHLSNLLLISFHPTKHDRSLICFTSHAYHNNAIHIILHLRLYDLCGSAYSVTWPPNYLPRWNGGGSRWKWWC